jgi:hypothetical protein
VGKKRKRNKGKSKGSAFEREMCKCLSAWWTGGTDTQVFWRNSGFLARGPGCTEHQYGDVHAIAAPGQDLVRLVNIELKFYKDLRVLDVIDKPGKGHVTLIDHWRQCLADAAASEREPFLIAKRNFAEPFVMCLEDLAQRLVEDGNRLTFYAEGNYVSLFALSVLMLHNDREGFLSAFEEMCQDRICR